MADQDLATIDISTSSVEAALSVSPADAILRDGSSIEIRPLRSTDRLALDSLFAQMSADAHPHHFVFPTCEPTRADVDCLADTNGRSQIALAATSMQGGHEVILGVGRYVALASSPRMAEVSFDVLDAYHGRGVATLLLENLARVARNNGFSIFCADVDVSNHEMLEVFAHSGFTVHDSPAPSVHHIEIQLADTELFLTASAERERVADAESLQSLFAPASVAVIGASRSLGNIGRSIVENLISAGFRGRIYPVNPAAVEIAGHRCYPSIHAIASPIDLAVIAVPSRAVEDVLNECAAAGVRSAVVISAGFAETSSSGRNIEHQLRAIARSSGMRMVGPNCLGVLSTAPAVRLNATFSPAYPPAGNVSMATQSGALGLAMIDYARDFGIGIAEFASLGNKADVSVNDVLSRWYDDARTSVVALYLESFGNPHTFLRLAPEVTRRKPVVAMKSGRSPAGTRAASSHSAALANLDVGIDALFAQTGVIRTDTLEQLFDIVSLLSNQPIPAGPRIGVVTNAGGPGILLADACETHGLTLPTLAASTLDALRALLPAQAGLSNPIDMIASATADQFTSTIELVGKDPNVDAVVVIYVPPMVTRPAEIAQAIALGAGSVPRSKPIAVVFMSAHGTPEVLASGARGTLPSYRFPENAAAALATAVRYGSWRNRPPGLRRTFSNDQGLAIRARVRAWRQSHPHEEWLPFEEIAALLAILGVAVADHRVAVDATAAAAMATQLGFPVVLKAIAPGLLHKTDVGGVSLNLSDSAAVLAAAQSMTAHLAAQAIVVDGFLVQHQVQRGVESIVGVTTDPTLGPLIVAGIGGVAVEIYKDVAFRIAPITDVDASEMLSQLRGRRLFEGFRGAPPADRAALTDVLLAVSGLVELMPELMELDLNPVVVLAQGAGAVVVDARLRLTLA